MFHGRFLMWMRMFRATLGWSMYHAQGVVHIITELHRRIVVLTCDQISHPEWRLCLQVNTHNMFINFSLTMKFNFSMHSIVDIFTCFSIAELWKWYCSLEASYSSQKKILGKSSAIKICFVIHDIDVVPSHLLLLIEPPGTYFYCYVCSECGSISGLAKAVRKKQP